MTSYGIPREVIATVF